MYKTIRLDLNCKCWIFILFKSFCKNAWKFWNFFVRCSWCTCWFAKLTVQMDLTCTTENQPFWIIDAEVIEYWVGICGRLRSDRQLNPFFTLSMKVFLVFSPFFCSEFQLWNQSIAILRCWQRERKEVSGMEWRGKERKGKEKIVEGKSKWNNIRHLEITLGVKNSIETTL